MMFSSLECEETMQAYTTNLQSQNHNENIKRLGNQVQSSELA